MRPWLILHCRPRYKPPVRDWYDEARPRGEFWIVRIRLLLFARHRELAGVSQLELEVPERSTAEDVYSLLERNAPPIAALRPYTTYAVNREVVEPSRVLLPGDEIAFLLPSSGGVQ